MKTILYTGQRENLRVLFFPKIITRFLTIACFSLFLQSAHAQLGITFDITHVICSNIPTGRISVQPNGGTPPYRYLWDNGDTTATRTQLLPGTYSLVVTDAVGNRLFESVTVNGPEPLRVTFEVSSNCTLPVTIKAQASGGEAPYRYLWETGQVGQTQTFPTSGKYCVTVIDNKLCGRYECIPISITPLSVSVQPKSVTCPGTNTGAATLTVSGGVPPISYLWSNGATTQNLANIPGGNYSVTITDAAGCSMVRTTTVASPPPLTVNVSTLGPICAGEANGSIQITNIAGGTPPYRVQWHTGSNNMAISNLTEGVYILTITDILNCRITREITLEPRSRLQVQSSIQDETCPGQNNGRISLTMATGVAPFTISWSDGASGANRTGLSPGSYTATVTDATGCQKIIGAVIRAATPYSLALNKSDVSLCGVNNGSVEALVSGGNGPFSFSWSSGQTSARISNLSAGTYSVTVRDINGCQQFATTVVSPPPAISAQIAASAQVCQGASTGSASVSVSGGTAPFAYSWNNGASSQSLQNLPPGLYRVTVTDSRNCSAIAQATIAQAPLPSVRITAPATVCSGLDTATARPTVTGGTAPFTYRWNTGSTATNLFNLGTGTYRLTVTDNFGCTATDSARILVVAPIQLSPTITPVSCAGESNGAINLAVQGGLPAISFTWSNGSTGSNISNLRAGTYRVTATDAVGCNASTSATVTQPDSLKLTLTISDLLCGLPSSGTAAVRVQGGTGPFNYFWNTSADTDSLFNLNPGNYTVAVTDARGCEQTASGTVQITSAPQCDIVVSRAVSSPTASDGEAVVMASNGTGPYSFLWSNGMRTDTARNLMAVEYRVTVTDSKGCTGVCTVVPNVENALIGGLVWFDLNQNGIQDSSESVVPNVKVVLMEITNTPPPFMDTAFTNNEGRYTFIVKPGSYKVTFMPQEAFQLTITNATLDPTKDSDADRVLGTTPTIVVGPGEASLFWDAGLIDNIKFFPAIECECLNNATNPINGQYREVVQLQSISGDTWRIIRQNGMFLRTSPAPPAAPIPVAINTVMPEVSTGVYVFEFRHLDNQGYFIEVSNGMDTISLQNRCAYPVITDNIPDTLCFNDPEIPLSLPVNRPGRLTYTINGLPATSINPRALGAGLYELVARFIPNDPFECQAVRTILFRVITETCQVKIGDLVWFDKNANGIQDSGEEGIEGVKVILSRVGTQTVPVDSVISDPNGMYMFLTDPGSYKLTFIPPIPGFRAPLPHQGTNDAKDSDIDTLNFMTPVYTVALHNNNFTIDAGLIIPCENVTDPGEIGYNTEICFGAPTPPVVSLREASGGYGKLEYLWMYSTRSPTFDATYFAPIPNSNNPSLLQPPAITETTYFIRCVRRAACPDFLEPAPIRVLVKPQITATISVRDTFCLDAPINLKAEVSGAPAQVRWELSSREPGTFVEPNIAFGNVATFVPRAPGMVQVRITITRDGCAEVFTDSFRIVNIPGYCASAGMVLNALTDPLNRINLRWRISNDTEFREFLVEHAPDGERWTTLARIDKIMTVFDRMRYYEYIDEEVKNGRNFYRIRVQDEFGVARFSNIVSVAVQPEEQAMAYVFPNPVESILFLDILRNLPVNERTQVEIFSPTGHILRSWHFPASRVQERIDFSDFPVGIYFLRVKAGAAAPPQVIKVMKR